MHKFLRRTAVSILLLSALPSLASSGSWYKRHAEGWYWYNEPETVETEEPKVIEEPTPIPSPPPDPKTEKPMTPEGPDAFTTAWLEKMIPQYLANAVDNPTPENVEAFFILQRLAMDKAERFQKVAEQVRVGNKFIDESERRPTSMFGLQKVDLEAEKRKVALLEKISKMTGIFFFYKEGCPFCEEQAPILKRIEAKGFDVLAVSIGGGKLQSARFLNEVEDSGQAAMLSVESTPSIFLVHPESTTFALIGSSLLSLPDIEERIVLIAQRNGWVSEEEVNETRPRLLNANGIDLSKKLPELMKAVEQDPTKIGDLMALLEGRDAEAERENLTKMPKSKSRSLMDEKGFIEPKALLNIIKKPYTNPTTDDPAKASTQHFD